MLSNKNTRGLPNVDPASVGICPNRLARIQHAFQPFVNKGKVPGIVTAIARHGKVIHMAAQGYADIESGKPLSCDHIFRLYSMTKPVTGVAVMSLYEEGFFCLSDPIADYLPEFSNMQVYTEHGLVPAKRPITIEMLLTHTAGFTYQGLIPDLPCDVAESEALIRLTSPSLEQGVKQLADKPLIFHPGEQWGYGESMRVLARLVEVVSGQSYGQFLQNQIFSPLKMPDTSFYVPEIHAGRLTRLYEQSDNGLVAASPDNYGGDYTQKPSFEAGGAGLVSTVSDYLRFCQMLLNGGTLDDTTILSPTSVKMMVSDQLDKRFGSMPIASLGFPVAQGRGLGFGYCGLVMRNSIANGNAGSNHQYSWSGWANTDFWIDYDYGLIALIMTQVIPTREHIETRKMMHQMTYQAIIE